MKDRDLAVVFILAVYVFCVCVLCIVSVSARALGVDEAVQV